MSDFHQAGIIATIHRLRDRPIEELDREILTWSEETPVGLLIPSLFSELHGPALPGIVKQLAEVPYIDTIVIPVGRASAEEFEEAKQFFSVLPQRTVLIWIEGPRIQQLLEDFKSAGLPVGEPGKGRALWLALGYFLAENRCHTIALHDADILTYSRELVARLVYPLVSRQIDFDFCKGYYARVSDRLHGRVTRMLVFPLLRALEIVIGNHPYIRYLASFRYPLAGEFALDASLANVIRIPSNWGVEVGVLSEIYRNRSTRRICQAEILNAYDHKHQVVSADDPSAGLHRMAIDIVTHLLQTLSQTGIAFDEGALRSLMTVYRRTAEDFVAIYFADATIDGLMYDRHSEEALLGVFVGAIRTAIDRFRADPIGQPDLPNWIRVRAAIEDVGDRLLDIVRSDGGILGS
ncbi:MAG TPA: glycosyl transferase [Thermoanaerobaculia bacterium]|nr:glycosyl transferase [Thermoanaerobaculia bacterium]